MTKKCTTVNSTDGAIATTKALAESNLSTGSSHTSSISSITTLVNDIRSQLKGDGTISLPALAIGDGSKLAVATAACDYQVDGIRYTLAGDTTGVALGTTVIAQNTFGAVALDVPISGGTVVSTEAPANVTGYGSAVLAAAALPAVAAAHCRLGYVTVSNSAAAFTLNTTALDAANTTVAYTDADTVYNAIGAAIS